MPEITDVGDDGSVTVRFTPDEAADVRNDLDPIRDLEVSEAGNALYRLLDFVLAVNTTA